MVMKIRLTAICCIAAMLCSCSAYRQETGTGNPYLPLWEHLPDGEPRVFEDPDNPGCYRCYIIGSHDVRGTDYCGTDIRMWSAPVSDLNDWRDEGAIFTYNIDNQWDIMFAPDLVEIVKRDGSKEYYLYPHSRGWMREAMVCKGTRPDGPFTPVNLTEDGRSTVAGSILGFDPSVYIEDITDPQDPDYETGFRAYGYWGFQQSSAAQLDPNTMYSVRPGTDIISHFIPASSRYGEIRDPEGTEYPALADGQSPDDFNFFEASSIRKVGNKYIMIFSGHSGPDYGLGSVNSTLRYAYGDTPLGPWKSGGVLVDSRGIEVSRDGMHLMATNAAHNTHGSIENINGQWYVFYHRPPRGYGFARQAMVAPVSISCDETPVAEGGSVCINGYDPYAEDGLWKAEAADGHTYNGAEVTSEGFNIFGLDPYRYYSAGYACWFSDIGSLNDSWDIWNNGMTVDISDGDIVGYKYFGFGGLDEACKGLKPFEGTRKGNGTVFNLFLKPKTAEDFKIGIWLDGPWDNEVWKGKKIGEINVGAGPDEGILHLTADVSRHVDELEGKHAIFLIAEGNGMLGELVGLGFTKKKQKMNCPVPPEIGIYADGKEVVIPAIPVRADNSNGYTGYDIYETVYTLPEGRNGIPKITADSSDKDVDIDIKQAESPEGMAEVRFTYKGKSKNYHIRFIK